MHYHLHSDGAFYICVNICASIFVCLALRASTYAVTYCLVIYRKLNTRHFSGTRTRKYVACSSMR